MNNLEKTLEERMYCRTNGYSGTCGPMAISRAFNLKLKDCIMLCEMAGAVFYGSNRGMFAYQMTAACNLLNSKTEHYKFSKIDSPSLGKFASSHLTGTYIISVRGHLLAVKNGIIIDPNYNRIGRLTDKRKILKYWKVG